jgi:hypothetical protein
MHSANEAGHEANIAFNAANRAIDAANAANGATNTATETFDIVNREDPGIRKIALLAASIAL